MTARSSPDAPLDLGLLPSTATVDARGHLAIDGCDLDALAREHGTPLYVYSETELRGRAGEYRNAFGPDAVSYAGVGGPDIDHGKGGRHGLCPPQ